MYRITQFDRSDHVVMLKQRESRGLQYCHIMAILLQTLSQYMLLISNLSVKYPDEGKLMS